MPHLHPYPIFVSLRQSADMMLSVRRQKRTFHTYFFNLAVISKKLCLWPEYRGTQIDKFNE